MKKDAIFHRPMSEYAFGLDEDTTVFRLRCAGGDLEGCTFWYGDTSSPQTPVPFYPEEMHLVFHGENSDWWEVRLSGKFHRLYYYFELSGKGETFYYYGGVFSQEPSMERSEYFKFPFNHRADIASIPDWARGAVVYNIFPDSFASSRRAVSGCGIEKHAGSVICRSRLGGTIKGIRENLDYIAELGINCLYLNPIFAAGQYHKYDTIDYFHVDPCFGTDADFRALVEESHARGIRIILDGVFNHCGSQFFAFRDVLEKQENSPYASWFYRLRFPVRYPETGEKPNYECFCYERLMPKLDTANSEVCDYLCQVGEYWLREYGTDGWRLDVADEADDAFWREFRRRCKRVKRDALLIGEVWGDARHWLSGDMLDSAMNYDFRNHCRHFFAEGSIDAHTFAGRCGDMLMRYKKQIAAVQLNILDSHDTSRFLTLCKGDKRRLKLAVLFMCCFVGMPCVFYGDELGTEGLDELDFRRAMPWRDGDRELLAFYQEAIALRLRYPALQDGELNFLRAEPNEYLLIFERKSPDERIVVTLNASEDTVYLSDGEIPPFSWKVSKQ